jgi:CBS-domain-containing membrane protein
MTKRLCRWLVGGDSIPAIQPIVLAGLGGALAIAAVARLHGYAGMPWLLGSFGASCVLLFGFPDAPFSKPRNVFGGHLLCTVIGLAFLTGVGPAWWSLSLAFAVALMLMLATRTVHPPAGSNPVIIFLLQPDWHFLLCPILAGLTLLWLVAQAFNRATRRI